MEFRWELVCGFFIGSFDLQLKVRHGTSAKKWLPVVANFK